MIGLLRRLLHRGEEPVDLAAVCRDDQVIDAVLAGDIDHALLIAEQPEFVALLCALRAGRQQ